VTKGADLLLSGAEEVAVPGLAGEAGQGFVPYGERQQAYSVLSGWGIRSSARYLRWLSIRSADDGWLLAWGGADQRVAQLAGTELWSRTGFRNKVAGTASKAPREPRTYAQNTSSDVALGD
jgi:hypothetical protein